MTDPLVQIVRRARIAHNGTVIDWGRNRWGWRCVCNEGRGTIQEALTDWDAAASELEQHEDKAIVDRIRLVDPNAEQTVALDAAVLAARIAMKRGIAAVLDALNDRQRFEKYFAERAHLIGRRLRGQPIAEIHAAVDALPQYPAVAAVAQYIESELLP